ncbi:MULTISPECIES: winged helix-turn-helix domain-containing protein [Enterococcus]|uniref:OmpR/PhoB-type domain-containing protein n=1 Tax=Candidatus Enterococcus ferrettii TaxID=2815324 RepID=A0ABV0ER54_9ENTE|nr:helix-turn-helix domain-containing protein [Enterococcus sp. 665A]
MYKVLILTKNILAEQQLQKQLQLLDYEVFCSKESFRNLKLLSITDFFPVIMLSETISNLEIEKFLPYIDQTNSLVVRLVMDEPNEEELRVWQELGVTGGLAKSLSFDGFREELVRLQNAFYKELHENKKLESPAIDKIENRTMETSAGRIYFSKKEERLFKMLLEAKGILIPRSDICAVLWSEGETDSNRSQLSCITTKIKNKFKAAGYQGDTIITKWGQGYGLNPDFYTYLSTDQAEESYPEFIRDHRKQDSMLI